MEPGVEIKCVNSRTRKLVHFEPVVPFGCDREAEAKLSALYIPYTAFMKSIVGRSCGWSERNAITVVLVVAICNPNGRIGESG